MVLLTVECRPQQAEHKISSSESVHQKCNEQSHKLAEPAVKGDPRLKEAVLKAS
jgi:hypothetical protein